MIDNKEELIKFINDNLAPKSLEKKMFGEVFTPLELVEEMLDTLPKDVWTNPELKWMEPSCGIGNFMICIFYRLMDGLKGSIKEHAKRERHIIENMLYMAELNEANAHICKSIFKGYKMNLFVGDFLELDTKKRWGIEEFDIIVGNPPYNKGGIRSYTGEHLGEEKSETIWPKFVDSSFELLKKNGYLVFITPLSWLKKSHSVHEKILEKHVIWMKLWDDSQSKEIINADIPISLYVLQNKINNSNEKTVIECNMKRQKLNTKYNEYLNKKISISTAYHSIFNKLINFIETKNLKLEYSTKTVKSTGTKTKIPSKYKLEDMLAIDTYTIKEGIMVKKANQTHPDANKRKIIIANKRGFKGAFIDNGKLSLTGNHKFYILGNNLELIIKMLNFRIIDIISDNLKYGQSFLDSEAFTYLPDIRKLGIKDIDEKKFYKLIGLTQDELDLLEDGGLFY